MSYQIKIASDQIKQDVPLTEASIDEALISVSNLMSTLIRARLDTGVPAATVNWFQWPPERSKVD